MLYFMSNLHLLKQNYFFSAAQYNEAQFKACRESVKSISDNFCNSVSGIWFCFDELNGTHPNPNQFIANLNAKIDTEDCDASLKRPLR
jgi:hypothetical protein